MKNYIPFQRFDNDKRKLDLQKLIEKGKLSGTELVAADIVTRENDISELDVEKYKKKVKEGFVKRLHMSYWAETSDFLERVDFDGLKKRFGSNKNIINYFGDLTGEKMYSRWVKEYSLAKDLDLESVTFHLIDYFHIDGMWNFTNKKSAIILAQARILNRLLQELEKNGLLENGPIIEVENAGFCLEYGIQTALDFEILFRNIQDAHNKVRIAWDINHLLHAIGIDATTGSAKFMLTGPEVTMEMRKLESTYGSSPHAFVMKWLKLNLVDPKILPKVATLHLSDCILRSEKIFVNGQFTNVFLDRLIRLPDDTAREKYGTKMVRTYFDSHIPVGPNSDGIISVVRKVMNTNPNINFFYELKGKVEVSKFQKQIALFGN